MFPFREQPRCAASWELRGGRQRDPGLKAGKEREGGSSRLLRELSSSDSRRILHFWPKLSERCSWRCLGAASLRTLPAMGGFGQVEKLHNQKSPGFHNHRTVWVEKDLRDEGKRELRAPVCLLRVRELRAGCGKDRGTECTGLALGTDLFPRISAGFMDMESFGMVRASP